MTTPGKSILLCCVAFVLTLSSLRAQDEQPNEWLRDLFTRLKHVEDKAVASIAEYREKIDRCDKAISESEARADRARQKRISRKTIEKELEAKRRYQAAIRVAEIRKSQAGRGMSTVAKEMVRGRSTMDAIIGSSVGRLEIYSDPRAGLPGPAEDGRAALNVGDEIVTHENSKGQLYCMDGMCWIDVDANTRLKLESSDSGSQAFGLMKGKLYVAVNRAVDSVMKQGRMVRERVKKKVEIRTPTAVCGVRGTQFMISTDDSGGTTLAVFEGSVSVRSRREDPLRNEILVNGGYQLKISSNGEMSEPNRLDAAEAQRWWEQ
jgi:hypothetical protein